VKLTCDPMTFLFLCLNQAVTGPTQQFLRPGLDLRRDFDAVLLEHAADGPPKVLSGEAAALWGAGIGWPGFAAVARGPQGARFIGPDAGEIKRILARQPSLQPVTLPANSYPGQTQALPSVGSWSYVFATEKLSVQTAYMLAKAIHRAEPQLAARLEQARETTMANTLAAAPRQDLIHPGVLKYLGEAGLKR